MKEMNNFQQPGAQNPASARNSNTNDSKDSTKSKDYIDFEEVKN